VNLPVSDHIHLTDIRPSDKNAFIEHLNEKEIYDNTLRIPFPYTEKDANEWITLVAQNSEREGQPIQFAIRDDDERLIGGCGFDGLRIGKSHRAEIGYWLAKPYWGRGIMTAVVGRLCDYAFNNFGLVKITAHVFTSNPASGRILEKCGFQLEGVLKKHFEKDGHYLDSNLYGLLK
jgi:RimJ/RimL family protein N-acetyltransferase